LYVAAGALVAWKTGAFGLVFLCWLLLLPGAGVLFFRRREKSAVAPSDHSAASIAHDVNNLLGVMRTSLEVLESRIETSDPLRGETRAIGDAITRGSGLLQLLIPGRAPTVHLGEAFDLKHTVGDLVPLLRRTLPRTVELHVRAEATIWVLANQPELERLIVNLVANARDALAGSGEVWIDLVTKWLDRDELPEGGRLQPGWYAVLRIRDTGPGITDAILPQIFDPYFTTKAPGAGTGLGLAASRDLICKAGGDVMVTSQAGEGTCFKILLPERTAPDSHLPAASRSRRLPSGFGPGTPLGLRVWAGEPGSGVFPRAARALVVEDQPELLRATARVLRRAGYEVLTASDAEAAAEIAREGDERVSLLVTDVQLPGRSGPELAREFRERDPALALVFVTGASGSFPEASDPKAVFVKKPYLSAELLSAVRRAEALVA
jgi:two-component system cell cycle sensor histidine kinase/response regulator CckA